MNQICLFLTTDDEIYLGTFTFKMTEILKIYIFRNCNMFSCKNFEIKSVSEFKIFENRVLSSGGTYL